jgi:hypothetical protein
MIMSFNCFVPNFHIYVGVAVFGIEFVQDFGEAECEAIISDRSLE